MKSSRSFGVTGAVFVLVACGGAKHASSPASPRLVQACDAIAAKVHECQPRRNVEDMKKECTSQDIFRFFDAVKPADVSDKLLACITASACEAKVSDSLRACETDAVKTIPLSPRAKTLCAKLEKTLSDCSNTGTSAFRTPCDVEMRLYADEDLALFEPCVDRNCRGGTSCVNEAQYTVWSRVH